MEVEVNAPRSDNDTLLTHPTNRELAAWLTGGLMLHVQKADGQVGLGKPWDLAWVSHPPKQEWFLDLEYWYLGQDHTAPIPLWDLEYRTMLGRVGQRPLKNPECSWF